MFVPFMVRQSFGRLRTGLTTKREYLIVVEDNIFVLRGPYREG